MGWSFLQQPIQELLLPCPGPAVLVRMDLQAARGPAIPPGAEDALLGVVVPAVAALAAPLLPALEERGEDDHRPGCRARRAARLAGCL